MRREREGGAREDEKEEDERKGEEHTPLKLVGDHGTSLIELVFPFRTCVRTPLPKIEHY